MNVVDDIANAPRNMQDRPNQVQRIKQITVDTFGINYAEPEKV